MFPASCTAGWESQELDWESQELGRERPELGRAPKSSTGRARSSADRIQAAYWERHELGRERPELGRERPELGRERQELGRERQEPHWERPELDWPERSSAGRIQAPYWESQELGRESQELGRESQELGRESQELGRPHPNQGPLTLVFVRLCVDAIRSGTLPRRPVILVLRMPDNTLASFRPAVPAECRRWARSHDARLEPLVARLIELGTVVLDRMPSTIKGVPSLPQLLSYASVPTDSVDAFAFDPDGAQVVEVPDFVPSAELARARSTGTLDSCPVLVGRLRAYASSCQLVHPDVGHDHLAYLTTSYAVALGLPLGTAGGLVTEALALRGGLPDPRVIDGAGHVGDREPSLEDSDAGA